MPPVDPEPNDEEKQEEVPGDDQSTPFSPPDDIIDPAPADHPQEDTGLQPEEIYDAGISAASGVSDPAGPTPQSPPQDAETEGYDIEPTEDDVIL
jgi:hypothetical protein